MPVQTGMDPLFADLDGTTALHAAAGACRPFGIRALKSLVSIETWQLLAQSENKDNKCPWQLTVAARSAIDDFTACFGNILQMPARSKAQERSYFEMNNLPAIDCLLLLMPKVQTDVLIDGWLSPRTAFALTVTAELFGDSASNHAFEFKPKEPMPMDNLWMIGKEYFPPSVGEVVFKSFVGGWEIMLSTIAILLNARKAPTVSNITRVLNGGTVDMRYVQHYFGRGGTVYHALNCVIDATKKCQTKGDYGWEWETFQDDINALPETALDFDWDFVRYRLMEIEKVGSALGHSELDAFPNGITLTEDSSDDEDWDDGDAEEEDDGY